MRNRPAGVNDRVAALARAETELFFKHSCPFLPRLCSLIPGFGVKLSAIILLERYARAREAQADKYFQEIVEIADAATPETVNVARLRVDSRKFAVARLAPKKYGDRISHDVKGGGSNFQPQILIQCSSAGDDEGYIDISAASEAAGGLPQQGNGNSLPGTGGRR